LSHDPESIPGLDDLEPDQPRGFQPAEMITCDACLRANPPTRTNCLYCLAVLPVAKGAADLRKPTLRPLEEWEPGFNNVLVQGQTELSPQAREEIATLLRLQPDLVQLILSHAEALPLARAASFEEASLTKTRLQELGAETIVVSDSDLLGEHPQPRRIRALGLSADALLGREALADADLRVSWDDIYLIVAGRLVVKRVEVEENKFRSGERELIDSWELSDDEPVVDIYSRERDGGWRIAARSFDFSCLGEQKKLLATENFVSLLQVLQTRSPNAAFDDSYPGLRKLLSAVWPLAQQTQGSGWRRARPGKYNIAAVTISNNETQFTRYSRLRHYLRLQRD
jgi:hypothetical protein